MTIARYVQLVSGSFVVVSLALGAPVSPVFHSQSWLWFTGFVGVMMVQSAITGFCPMGIVLKALGVKTCAASAE